MSRRKGREQAFLLIFEKYYNKEDSFDEIIKAGEETRDEIYESFAKELIKGIEDKFDSLDKIISKYSVKWSTDRISKVALAVLRLAVYEMFYEKNIPVNVSINEAVELCKKYGGDEDSVFVNGILGTISKEVTKNSVENILSQLVEDKIEDVVAE